MKKVFLFTLVAALFAGVGVKAQGLKGVWFGGGNISAGTAKDADKNKTTTFGVMPVFGKFISPTVAVGGALGYNYEKVDKDKKGNNTKTNAFVIQPLVRKYWNVTGKLYFFAQAALPVSIGNSKVGLGDSQTKTDNFGVGLAFTPGFDLILTDWLTIEASVDLVSLNYGSSKVKGGNRATDFGLDADLFSKKDRTLGALNVGVKILF